MILSYAEKEKIKKELVEQLKNESEITRIVIFGSFLTSESPNDLDVAIFQTTSEKYLSLALKYRRLLDHLAEIISLDVIPLRENAQEGYFMKEIGKGEILYEAV